jgi:hypothetical protein
MLLHYPASTPLPHVRTSCAARLLQLAHHCLQQLQHLPKATPATAMCSKELWTQRTGCLCLLVCFPASMLLHYTHAYAATAHYLCCQAAAACPPMPPAAAAPAKTPHWYQQLLELQATFSITRQLRQHPSNNTAHTCCRHTNVQRSHHHPSGVAKS